MSVFSYAGPSSELPLRGFAQAANALLQDDELYAVATQWIAAHSREGVCRNDDGEPRFSCTVTLRNSATASVRISCSCGERKNLPAVTGIL